MGDSHELMRPNGIQNSAAEKDSSDDPVPLCPSAGALPGAMALSDQEFGVIRSLVHSRLGIHLTETKRALVIGRLQRLVRDHGFGSFREYCRFLQADASGQALAELADRISTTHTFFYREKPHFEYVMKVALPEVVERKRANGKRDVRVWSAGCASGEEPYLLIMLMLEFLGTEYVCWDAGALATDISANALATARVGVYKEERLKHLPSRFRLSYFEKVEPGLWRVSDRVRREVTFRRFNLMNAEFPFKQPFDIIFCRNVMIYFDAETRRTLAESLFRSTAPGGYLFIGHSESLARDSCPYDAAGASIYRRPD